MNNPTATAQLLEGLFSLVDAISRHRRTACVHLANDPHRGLVLYLSDYQPTHRAFRDEVRTICEEYSLREEQNNMRDGIATFQYHPLPSLEELGSPIAAS